MNMSLPADASIAGFMPALHTKRAAATAVAAGVDRIIRCLPVILTRIT
jgi:hypothetical protein